MLGPKAESQCSVPRFCQKVGSKWWVQRLVMNGESHDWIKRFGPMVGSFVGSKSWVQRLCPKAGSQEWGPSQGRVLLLDPKGWLIWWVPTVGP